MTTSSPSPIVTMPLGGGVVPTLHERIYRELRAHIIAGRYAPGDALTIRGLAEQAECSPVPVRDALGRLLAERALEMPNVRAFRIPLLSRAMFEQLNHFRAVAEGYVIAQSAHNMTDAALEPIVASNKRFLAALRDGRIDDALEANIAFMFAIYAAADQPVVLPHIESLWVRSGPYLRPRMVASSLSSRILRQSATAHQQIIDRLAALDGNGAREALMADLAKTPDLVFGRPRDMKAD